MKNIYKFPCIVMLFCTTTYAQQDSVFIAKWEKLQNLGYGVTVKAIESSASVSEISSEEIMESGATNPLNALYIRNRSCQQESIQNLNLFAFVKDSV